MPMTTQYVKRVDDLDAEKARLEYIGFYGVIPYGTTDNVVLKITNALGVWVDKARIILQGHDDDDTFSFQVVDVDNILGYGAGTILDQFASQIPVDLSLSSQDWYDSPYVAYIMQGLYIRVVYASTGTTDVKLKAVVRTHRPRV